MMKKLVLLITFLLSACTNTSPTIQSLPEGNLQLRNLVDSETNNYVGEQVRWGGSIVSVSTENGRSILEIKHYPLMRHGFPLSNLYSQGNFFAESNEAFDPDVYIEGLLITFSGTITSELSEVPVNHHKFMPHIEITDAKLWPHHKSNGRAYTYMGSESEFKGYGTYGSGHYFLY
ncbi:MAG: Slp family lipoprotein [Proteobacteria bacterium]|nr:Slp family lipoprotein [Pseudomonadota bacterium]